MRRLLEKVNGLMTLRHYSNTLGLIVQRTFLAKSGLAVYKLDDLVMLADHHGSDHNGMASCFVKREYRYYLEQLALPNDLVVFDLGANIGSFTLMLHQMGFQIKEVVAVEMNPQTFSRMQFNLFHNLPIQPDCRLGAVTTESGFLSVEKTPGNPGQKLADSAQSPGNFRVPKIPVPELFSQRTADVDLCKIDIEGEEYPVFAAGLPPGLSCCKAIIIEIHNQEGKNPADVQSAFTSAGYKQLPADPTFPCLHCFRKK